MKHKQSESSLTTLANANELTRNVIQRVVGNDVADTLEGSPLTRATIYTLTQARIQANLSRFLKA